MLTTLTRTLTLALATPAVKLAATATATATATAAAVAAGRLIELPAPLRRRVEMHAVLNDADGVASRPPARLGSCWRSGRPSPNPPSGWSVG